MSKFSIVFSSLFVILLVIFGALYTSKTFLLAHTLSSELSTHVSIKSLLLSPMSQIQIQEITIENPKNFPKRPALEVSSLTIVANYLSYLKSVTHIDSITLVDTFLYIDLLPNGKTNWEALMHGMSTKKGSHGSYYAIIDTLSFQNLQVRIRSPNGSVANHTIPMLQLKNIKTNEGELTRYITQAVLYQAISNIRSIINIPIDISSGGVDRALDVLDLFMPK